MSDKIVQLNEEVIKGQLKELVRGSVEETLNELLEAEAASRSSILAASCPGKRARTAPAASSAERTSGPPGPKSSSRARRWRVRRATRASEPGTRLGWVRSICLIVWSPVGR